jgi:hypothetical protein
MGQRAAYFSGAAAIANSAGIHLTRELEFALLPRVVGRLEDPWVEIGLAKRAA